MLSDIQPHQVLSDLSIWAFFSLTFPRDASSVGVVFREMQEQAIYNYLFIYLFIYFWVYTFA